MAQKWGQEDDEEMEAYDPEEELAMAQVRASEMCLLVAECSCQDDWQEELQKKPRSNTKTRAMLQREAQGLPPFDPPPEGVDVIGYATFFDSIFELADVLVGQQGVDTITLALS